MELLSSLLVHFANMKLITFAVTFGLGLVTGVVLGRIFWPSKPKPDPAEETLRRNFGEVSTVTTFTFDEAMDWLTQHDDLMQNGCEAAVFKVNNQTLSMVNKKFNIDFGVSKYLVIGIRKKQAKTFQKSLLVKYDKLDHRLESELAQGKGFMVIGD